MNADEAAAQAALREAAPAQAGPRRRVARILRMLLPAAVGALTLLVALDQRHVIPGYVSWHSLLEVLSVAMSLLVGVTAAYAVGREAGLRALAPGFIAVALLDLQHLLSFPGMPDWLGPATVERSIAYWLGARSAVLWPFLALLAPPRMQRPLVLLAIIHLLGWSLYGQTIQAAPALWFDPVGGLTATKIGFEFALVAAYLLLALQVRARDLPLRVDLLAAGLAVLAAGELFFTLYREAASPANLFGHVFKLLGQAFFLRAVLLAQVIDPLRALQREIRARESWAQRLLDLFRGAPEGIMVVHPDGRVVACNPLAERMFGFAEGELRGQPIDSLVPAHDRTRHAELRAAFHAQPNTRSMAALKELKARRKDQGEFYADVSLAPVEWHGESCALAFVRDASERVAQLQRLSWLASHDELTGLPNRWGLQLELERQLRAGGRGGCLLFGIDNLGRINDALGRDSGDALLRRIAAELPTRLPAGHFLSRLEGDKFLCLLPGWDASEAQSASLCALLRQTFDLEGGARVEVVLTAGSCLYPDDGDTAALLLQRAEITLSLAKRVARQRLLAFCPEHAQQGRRWFGIASRLPRALHDNEFHLVFQPRVRLLDRSVAGYEVLLRWGQGEQAISPAEFVPVAEQTGFIVDLGRWVLDQTMAQARAWQQAGLDFGRIAINLSTRQLADTGLPQFLRGRLSHHQLRPQQIELEITETAAMENLEWALSRLQDLAAVGVELALDDFGTGYSSLAYLQSLPCSVIKADIAFVRRIGTPEGDTLLRAILGLAQAMGKRCVAEGVETEAQVEWLRRHGCSEGQGYLFAAPLPPAQVMQQAVARSLASASDPQADTLSMG